MTKMEGACPKERGEEKEKEEGGLLIMSRIVVDSQPNAVRDVVDMSSFFFERILRCPSDLVPLGH